MKSLVASAAVIAAFSVLPAQAGDAFIASDGHDWTGFYVGIVGGAGAFEGSARDNGDDALDAAGLTVSLPSFGGTAGAGISALFQDGAAVYGVDADISYVSYSAEKNIDEDYLVQASMDWLGTLRGRVGMAVDNAMFYATAGIGYANIQGCATDLPLEPCTPDGDQIASIDEGVWGLVAGGGTEVALTENVSMKAEYLYFQSAEANTVYDADSDQSIGGESVDFWHGAHLARLGVNWGF